MQRSYDKKGNLIRKFVTKKSLIETEASGNKTFLRTFTEKHPEVFKDFRKKASAKIDSLCNEDLGSISNVEIANYLIHKLKSIPPGTKDATIYHRTIVGILEFIFYPRLICPVIENEIHDGRKRIDITFDNAAKDGFLYEIHMVKKIPSQYVFIECKNYSSDLKNPELDQIAGRFSPNRGKFGLILCREISKNDVFIKRCQDTYNDDRGLIIPLTDQDLIFILKEMSNGKDNVYDKLLNDRCREIIIS